MDETIPDALAGERIDRVVALLTGGSRSEAAASVADGQILVNGSVVTRTSLRLAADDQVSILENPRKKVERPAADPEVQFRVVHADGHVIVIDKPAGLVVHPGAGRTGSTLVNGLLARFPELAEVGEDFRPGLVHRLDRGTSGLLVVARTPGAHEDLVNQLSTHRVQRVYTALTWGSFEHPKGVIDAPIGRSRRDPLRMTVAVDGRPSRTHFAVDREFSSPVQASLLTCRLETGRTHQIRVHLSSVGNPVVGDSTYGGDRPSFGPRRPFLHARTLTFAHPLDGRTLTFESDLPEDLRSALNLLS